MRALGFRVLDKEVNQYRLSNELFLGSDGELMFPNFGMDNVKMQRVNQKRFILERTTGVRDKNGKMIYEGDIVKMRYPYDRRCVGKFVVVKDSNSPRIGLLDKTKTDEIFDLYSHMSNHYEVIGNINLNPELLEENKSA